MTCKLLATVVALTGTLLTSSVSAQEREVRVAPAARTSAVANTAPRGLTLVQSNQARITGVVVTMHEPPRAVPNALVRLRASVGKIVDMTRTNEKGEFAFVVTEAGSYYVELVDDKGRVLAVEDVGETTVSVSLGHVSTTIIRVPVHLAQGAWANAAKAILAAAASSGIAGVTTTTEPTSPEK